MKKLLIAFSIAVLGFAFFAAYSYFTQARIAVASVQERTIIFAYANLPLGFPDRPPYGAQVSLVDAQGQLWTIQWKPQTSAGSATVVATPGTPAGRSFLRVLDADTGKIIAESNRFDLAVEGPPMASIDTETLTSTSATPVITGTSNMREIGVVVEQRGVRVYGEESDVGNGKWMASITPALAPGTYTVKLYDSKMERVLSSGTLRVLAK